MLQACSQRRGTLCALNSQINQAQLELYLFANLSSDPLLVRTLDLVFAVLLAQRLGLLDEGRQGRDVVVRTEMPELQKMKTNP